MSPRVCVCASMSGSRRGAGAQRLVGPGLCVGLGEGSLPLPRSMSTPGGWWSSAVLGGDGHVFPFPVAGGGDGQPVGGQMEG